MHPLTDQWWRLFINRTDGSLRASGRGWHFDPRELTPSEVSTALYRHQALGVYAVSEAGTSRWVCLDADTPDGRAALASLAATLDCQSTLVELSRRGGHLWLFCPPTPWSEARTVGLELARRAGIACEVFPKGPGRSGVRLPLTFHPKTGETYPAVDGATGEVLSEEKLLSLEPTPLPAIRLPRRVPVKRSVHQPLPGSYHELASEIEHFTSLREYAPERAVGRCPFHDDRHPSLSLLGGFWRCWAGCGEGGLAAFRALARKHERR